MKRKLQLGLLGLLLGINSFAVGIYTTPSEANTTANFQLELVTGAGISSIPMTDFGYIQDGDSDATETTTITGTGTPGSNVRLYFTSGNTSSNTTTISLTGPSGDTLSVGLVLPNTGLAIQSDSSYGGDLVSTLDSTNFSTVSKGGYSGSVTVYAQYE